MDIPSVSWEAGANFGIDTSKDDNDDIFDNPKTHEQLDRLDSQIAY